MFRQLASVSVVLLFCCGAHAAEPENTAIRAIVTDAADAVAPGCAVGVFRDGKAETMTASGFADVATRRRIDRDTLFYAASLSKQFTALAVAQLVVAKKIALNDDVRNYLPELPEYRAPITVAMLLHHTSGIRDNLTLMRLAGRDPALANGRDVSLRLLFNQKSTNFIPGTAFTYSNGGYLLLAEIVARVSGEPFSVYAGKQILAPLGMTSSYFLDGSNPGSGDVAHGYVPDGDGFAIRDTYPRFSGSGGLMINMRDLAHYEYDIARGHRVWTAPIRKIVLTPGRLTDGSLAVYPSVNMHYAAGLQVGMRDGQYFVMHGGGAEGFKHEYARLPRVGLSVAVLCNRGDWNPLDRLEEIINVVQPRLLHIPTPENLRGRYYSGELSAVYTLEPQGPGLKVTIHPSGMPSTHSMVLKKSRADGHKNDNSYASNSTRLIPDPDGMGFTLETDRASGLHLTRVTDPKEEGTDVESSTIESNRKSPPATTAIQSEKNISPVAGDGRTERH